MKQPDDIFSQMLPFWEHLTPQEQMALREASVPSTLPKGTITHRADQDCKGILLLLSGQLRAFLLSEEGREVTLYRVREGETCVLSSSCLMDAIVFDVLIEAIEETHVITLPVTALSPLAQQRPEIELFLYKTASERFSDIMWTMQQILFMGMDRRAAIFLWDESAQKGPVLRITHDEMARYIGSAREVVTKVLKYFAQEGIVALRRGTITILDREKLRRLTGMASVEERTPRPQKSACTGISRAGLFYVMDLPQEEGPAPAPVVCPKGSARDTAQTRPGSGNPPSAP